MLWRRTVQRERSRIIPRLPARILGLALAGLLLVAGCGTGEGAGSIAHDDAPAGEGRAAYSPVARSESPRVHADGEHEVADAVEIGPSGDEQGAPYVPVASAGSSLVHPAGDYSVSPAVKIGAERSLASGEGRGLPTSTPTTVAGAPHAKPNTSTGAAPRAAASPTVMPRLSLGPSLGASASGAAPSGNILVMDGDDEEVGTVSGRIEGAVGSLLLVQTETGLAPVQVRDAARIERDMPGEPADLKPGQFIGVIHLPNGPALSIRLYNTGPSMPLPGVVPMVGSRVGHVTTFGTIVSLQVGGLLMNSGSQTTPVMLLNTVEIVKPAPATAADIGVGAQIIATGPTVADGTVQATAIRVTAAAPNAAAQAQVPPVRNRP